MGFKILVTDKFYDFSQFRLNEIIWLDSDQSLGKAWSNQRTTNTSLTPDDYVFDYLYVSEGSTDPSIEFDYVGITHGEAPGFMMEDLIHLMKEGIIEVPIFGETLCSNLNK